MSERVEKPKQLKGERRYNAAGERWCTDHQAFLPLASFGPDPHTKDGLNVHCRDCNRERARAFRDRHAGPEWREKATQKAREWRALNPDRSNASGKRARRKLKLEVLLHYGDHCVCCGERTIDFLSLDHIDGGGNAQRREAGFGAVFYSWLKRNNYPDGLQVLCYNCNLAKGFTGQCPHTRGET